jgi:RNA ligase (TIGR02306 family)
MSETPVEIVTVEAIKSHPNADRLEIVTVLGTQFIAPRTHFIPGQLCVYFPPDVLIPEPVAETLGVKNYLKHAIYPGDTSKTQCRIGAIRLRGQPSFGFGLPFSSRWAGHGDSTPYPVDAMMLGWSLDIGTDVSEAFASNAMPEVPAFHKYTNIQHYYRYANSLKEGTPVRITEKIHGTNFRAGTVLHEDCFQPMCGSHNVRVGRESGRGNSSLYWMPLTDNMVKMLGFISMDRHSVIVFGEIYGPQVQSMDYGLTAPTFRVFDISVDSQYMDWGDVKAMCDLYDINTVPVLYEGPFDKQLVDRFISGPTRLAAADNIKCDFKGREGIVITPQEETYCPALGGRLILKAVSPDYLEKT